MNIAIAEDHNLIYEGLKILLESHSHTIHYAPNASELTRILKEEEIEILIQDIRFGTIDARTFLPRIIQNYPSLKILVLTSLDDVISIQSILAHNVSGYIIKTEPSEIIIKAINQISEGRTFLSPEVMKVLAGETPPEESQISLSEREKEVLKGVLNEKSTKEIAESIHVSEKTVEYYRSNLLEKFDAKNVSGLVKKAILLGYYK